MLVAALWRVLCIGWGPGDLRSERFGGESEVWRLAR